MARIHLLTSQAGLLSTSFDSIRSRANVCLEVADASIGVTTFAAAVVLRDVVRYEMDGGAEIGLID